MLFLQEVCLNDWLNAQVSVFEMVVMILQTNSIVDLNEIEVWVVGLVYLASALLFEINSPAFE